MQDMPQEAAEIQAEGRSRKSPTAFRTISEVAEELNVQQHVLRFWETKFSQVKPLKRGGGRRYYRPEDVALLRRIHHLLYSEGYTIKGVQKLLKGQGRQQIISQEADASSADIAADGAHGAVSAAEDAAVVREDAAAAPAETTRALSDRQRVILQAMLGDLKDLRDMIKGE